MGESKRIGLTKFTNQLLDELLDEINPNKGESGDSLSKKDIYRLAIALGIKNGKLAPSLDDTSNNNYRLTDIDKNGVFSSVLESTKKVPPDTSIYSYIERLAEQQIKDICKTYNESYELPFNEWFKVKETS